MGSKMNIQTVKTNLEKTIAGKEQLLTKWQEFHPVESSDRSHKATMVGMLELNIDELKRILEDVEQCIPKSEYSLDGPMIKMFRED
jgi:hypothetical protein